MKLKLICLSRGYVGQTGAESIKRPYTLLLIWINWMIIIMAQEVTGRPGVVMEETVDHEGIALDRLI